VLSVGRAQNSEPGLRALEERVLAHMMNGPGRRRPEKTEQAVRCDDLRSRSLFLKSEFFRSLHRSSTLTFCKEFMTTKLQNLLPSEGMHTPDLYEVLGVPSGLIDHINEADDWTSIILISGILEVWLTEAICSSFAMSKPLKVIQNLPLNGRTGKTTLAHELSLISDTERKFLGKFSEIRNSVAHGTSNFKFSFKERFELKDDSTRFRQFLIFDSAYDHCDELDIDFDQNPRSVIYANLLNTCLSAMMVAVHDEGDLYPGD
jgi:hypothetical protein